MKKTILLLNGLLFSIISFSQQQIGNGNMELWENLGTSTEEPINWNSFKTGTGSFSGAFGSTTIDQSSLVRPGSGTYCARIWTKTVPLVGILANGNMTLGRIEMGSSDASNPANYNYSITTPTPNTAFSEALTDTPDSLVFWVKYTNGNAASLARVSAILHDTYDYHDGFNIDMASAPHKVAEISHNYPSTAGQWVRKSLPWIYSGPASTNTFLLITFTTNMTPGAGNTNDEVLIDDIELIYNPVNQPVVANDDAVSTFQDVPVDVSVLLNDTDPENDLDLVSLVILTPPSNGNVSIDNVTGIITYTPNPSWFGTDTYVYTICDNGTPILCDNATVTVTVTEVVVGNNQIIANDDVISTMIDNAVISNVVTNDVDVENQIDLSSLIVTIVPLNGSTSVNNVTGEITYTPNPGYFGPDSYTYSICDAGTPAITCDEAVVSVTVNLNWGITEGKIETINVFVSDQQIHILSKDELIGNYSIYSSNGQLIQSGVQQNLISFSNPIGIYFIHLQTNKGTIIQKFSNL
jgi:hypothetical protein